MNTVRRVLLIIALFAVAGGCCTRVSLWRRYETVGGEEFLALYMRGRTVSYNYKYVGVRRGYYVMDYYDIGTGDLLDYRLSYRTPTSELPSGFPPKDQATEGARPAP